MDKIKVGIIGGGAAGLMAAIFAADGGADVTLIERNSICGRKIRITGKGRCNLTNDCDMNEFLRNVPTNPRFLYSALSFLSTEDTQRLFEGLGVPLKVERGRRVFPVSDRAADIQEALISACRTRGIKILTARAEEIVVSDGNVQGIKIDGETIPFNRAIVATGGMSYPRTGSDGDGYRFARELSHSVTPLIPSLVPLVSRSKICGRMQGLSLKNVALSVVDKTSGKVVYEDFGEMMFTHFGMTGPMILSGSAHLRNVDISKLTLYIDLKPALDEKTLDARLLSDFSANTNKDFINSLGALLPSKMIEPFIDLCGVDSRKKVNSITKEERGRILKTLKSLEIPLSKFRPIEEAIVTSGGVDVREITPKTLESKLCPNLFFAGEVIDVDAYTGGFNLQIAFSTGFLAGKSAAEI